MLDLSTESLEKLIKLLECQAATNNALHELVMQMNEKQKELEKNCPKHRRAKMVIER